MTRVQRSMAVWACWGMLLAPGLEGCAGDPPAGGQPAPKAAAAPVHLDPAYIPASAIAAVVAHPQALLAGPLAGMIPTEVITTAAQKEVGFDPLKIKEAVLVLA